MKNRKLYNRNERILQYYQIRKKYEFRLDIANGAMHSEETVSVHSVCFCLPCKSRRSHDRAFVTVYVCVCVSAWFYGSLPQMQMQHL